MPLDLEPEPDLRWTAFLYVAGELSPADAADFELRLADDPAAREAVIEAVDLLDVARRVAPEFRRPARRAILHRSLLAAASFAIAAGLVLSVSTWRTPDFRPRLDAAEVAQTWSSLRGVEPEIPALVDSSRLTIEATLPADLDVEDVTSGDRALPSWLLSAASAPIGQPARQED